MRPYSLAPILLLAGLSSCVASALATEVPAPQGLRVAQAGAGRVCLEWDAVDFPTVRGYRLHYSTASGSYGPLASWNGHQAAFTFTTDDGFTDNLVWAETFDRCGVPFTMFVIEDRIGTPGYMTEGELRDLHARGHEVASHTRHHPVLVRNTAFTVAYVGAAAVCELTISGDSLVTRTDGAPDLRFALADPSIASLCDLADTIDARPEYVCTLDYYRSRLDFCRSVYLVDVEPFDIAREPFLALTTMGRDSVTMVDEVVGSKAYLETMMGDTSYRCVSFAYPRHAHDQREMDAAREAGYLGARNGPLGEPRPGTIALSYNYRDAVDLYQAPVSWGWPPNDSTETWSRERIRSRIASWKNQHEWAIFISHTFETIDSAHAAWMMEEIAADTGVWVGTFGEIASYVRASHVTVENPIVAGTDSCVAGASLCGLPVGPWIYAVVTAYDSSGNESAWSNEVVFHAGDISTGLASPSLPAPMFALGAPRPNPMNPRATIPFDLDSPGTVRLAVYDVRGRLVSLLVDGEIPAGPHSVAWDGADGAAGSGVYFIRLDTPWGARSERILLIR